jgi:DNA ligase-1
MKEFAALVKLIDSTNKTTQKVAALSSYFDNADESDKLWTIAILSHRRPKRPVTSTQIREWATQISGIPLWLFEESYHIVGDLAETIALILPSPTNRSNKSLTSIILEIIELINKTKDDKRNYLQEQWNSLDYYERFVFNKILTGGFRIGVSQKLMTRALSQSTGIDQDILAHKLMGNWTGENTTFKDLIYNDNEVAQLGKPYPFYLAHPVEQEPSHLGNAKDYFAEHKWDGIRSQTILRGEEIFIWSRGEELVTDKYPELHELKYHIPPGTVIDGEILPFKDGNILNFNDLQTRIGRKTVSKKLLEQVPVIITAYDLLEWEGVDLRQEPFIDRHRLLEKLIQSLPTELPITLSPVMEFDSWEDMAVERSLSRKRKSEGLMIKKKNSPYGVGRKKGDWWKWKEDPLTIDAVLTYAMRGHGRRANLFTDYTFGLWDNGKLVTFAKAYSGLTDAEFKEIDSWIKKNTLKRFGPVRSVTPYHVFEIAFEGLAPSKRHKSGVATRFPRILRWRKDKTLEQANSLQDLKDLIPK